jgi:tetratricopeptide (TPR) repeat protein
LEQALVEFNKVLFYDKTIPEVYVEKAEIYIKLCDFSSAISCFKKALHLKSPVNQESQQEWTERMNTLFFMKGLTMIEEGYCNDALNLVSSLQSEDVKFRFLNALATIRAGNKDLAF